MKSNCYCFVHVKQPFPTVSSCGSLLDLFFFLIPDRELFLKFKPEQPFYVAGQPQNVEISIGFRREDSKKNDEITDEMVSQLLAPLELTCTIISRRASKTATTNFILDMSHEIFLSGSMFYYITCEAMNGRLSVFNDMFVYRTWMACKKCSIFKFALITTTKTKQWRNQLVNKRTDVLFLHSPQFQCERGRVWFSH